MIFYKKETEKIELVARPVVGGAVDLVEEEVSSLTPGEVVKRAEAAAIFSTSRLTACSGLSKPPASSSPVG